jgi:YjbE family integral membrane protein
MRPFEGTDLIAKRDAKHPKNRLVDPSQPRNNQNFLPDGFSWGAIVDWMVSTEFLSALAAIVVIDLVLAGDNAIVIALAARSLPPALQKRAIIWGTVGAIVVRSLMTLAVVWLLNIPGLMLAGGALLIWIAYKLLADGGQDDGEHGPAATTFVGAMKTIVIADAVMGLDNVLAVAGAAQGSYVLVVLGLLISIPIVIWGSTLILKWVERYPAIVYVGAGVLAWTAAKMMTSEPLVQPWLEASPWIAPTVFAVVIGGVLGAGWLANRRPQPDTRP